MYTEKPTIGIQVELEDFNVGDRVTWFDGMKIQEANVVGFDETRVILDTRASDGEVWKIWPRFLRKVDN